MTVENYYVIAIATLSDWLKNSRQFFNQWESKPIAPCTRDFSRASSELQVISRNCDWFIALSAPVVIGRSNYCIYKSKLSVFTYAIEVWACAYGSNNTHEKITRFWLAEKGVQNV